MACQIHRTKDGKINRVTAPSGSRSKLFDAINNNIFMSDAETSVKVMNNAYSDKVNKMFEGQTKYKYDTGEPQLFYKSPSNKIYDNLEDVLINEDFGQMSMGFRNPKNDEFTTIANFTTKGSVKNEFLHSKVREGILSADRVLEENGTIRYQGKGAYATTKISTAIIAADDLMAETGNGRYKIYDDGTIDIEFSKGYSQAIDTDGKTRIIPTETIPEYLKKNPDVTNKVDLLREFVWEYDIPIPIETRRQATEAPMTDLDTIEDALYSFLESIGFSTTSLEEYENNHNTKYGKGLHISAIIDIANSVVAFRNGTITTEELSEEVAHIAISTYSDQKSITKALVNVHMTPEYTEFSEKYRKAYADANPDLSASQVEDKVRKEILGKILSKEIINRFDTKNKTEEQANLITHLRNIWRWFTNLIQNNIKPYHERFLQDLNRDIANSVLNKTSQDFEAEISKTDDFFFSLLDDKGLNIERELRKSKAIIERLYSSVIEQKVPNQSELDRIGLKMSSYDIVSSANNVISVTARQLNTLKDNIEQNKKTGEVLSIEDSNRYFVLKEHLIPTVNNVIAGLREMIRNTASMKDFSVDETLKENINTIIESSKSLSLSEIEPYIDDAKLAMDEAELNKMLEHSSLTEEGKAQVRKDNEGNGRMRDLGWFGKFFGLSSQSKNPALQRMYLVATKILANTNNELQSIMLPMLDRIVTRNVEKYQRSVIHRDSDGKVTHFYISPRDYHWTETESARRENEYISEITGLTIEDISKRRAEGEVMTSLLRPTENEENADEISEERYQKFKDKSREIRDDLHERRFTEKYYQERDERYNKANVSDLTIRYLSGKNTSMNDRHRKAGVVNPDGTRDLSRLSKSDKQEDIEDFKNHSRIVSPYDSLGNLKEGIIRKKYTDLTKEELESIPVPIDSDYTGDVTLIAPGYTLESLDKLHDSRIALDLFNLNMLYRSELKGKAKSNEAVERFLEEIKDLEAKGEVAYEWLLSNASLGFTNEFYESMGTNPRYVELAQNHIDNIADASLRAKKQADLDHLIELQRARKELLKQNRKAKSTIETDAKHMLPQVKAKLLDLDDEIYEIRRDLNLPKQLFEDFGGVEHTEVDLNDDFYLLLEESDLDAFKFSLKNMSIRSSQKVYEFSRQIEDYINDRKSYLRKDFKAFANEVAKKGILKGKDIAGTIQTLKEEYAKQNIASYLQRFQPKGYTELVNALESGSLLTSEILENKEGAAVTYPALRYIEVSPDYAWKEDVNNSEYINPNYKAGDPLTTQPKKLNEEFFNRYGIRKSDYLALEDEDISKLTPTKNEEEYRNLLEYKAANEIIIENYNDTGAINPYLRPQVRKDTAERALTIHKTGLSGVKDWALDVMTSQRDEMDYGQVIEDTGMTVKLIPKYYQHRLDDPSLITNNTLLASIMALKASIKFKERGKAQRDVKAIQYRVDNQSFKARGIGGRNKSRITKKGEVSVYAEKIQEMADYFLYGIRQNRQMVMNLFGKEIQVDQLFSSFTNYVRNVNLAYNPLVDITSATTGYVNNVVDTLSGDYYHRSSSAKASKMLFPMVGSYMLEEGKLDKKSDLALLIEFFNIETPEEQRLVMSSYNRGIRIAANSYYLGAKYANLPITPRNMLAVLLDHKFHNGRFKSYNDFARDMRAETEKKLKNREITAMWNKLDDTFYSNLNIDPKKGISYNSKFEGKFESKEQAKEEFKFYHKRLMAKIAHINQSVDAIISPADQLAAQRDALVNAFMLHRSWFIINMARKFKGKHFNLATGQYEAGHYMTIVSTITKLFKNLTPSQRKEAREGLAEYEIRNLKRAGFDAIAIIALIALTNMLMDADDEDDSVIENLAQLIAMRTTNETQSQYIHGIPFSALGIYKDPLVQGKTIGSLFGLRKAFSEDEEKRKKAWNKFYKQFLLYRRASQLSDLQYQLDAYMHFHPTTLVGVTAVGKKKED